MSKASPIGLRAASLTLTGTLAVVVGTTSADNANATSGAIALGSLVTARLLMTYARHASSTTGRPRVRVDVSMDLPDTAPASVANWTPVQILDGASLSSGSIDSWPQVLQLEPSATGTTQFGTPPLDVSGAFWCRVLLADVDTGNPGAVTLLTLGGEASP